MKLKNFILSKIKGKEGRFLFVGVLNTIVGYAGYAFFCWIGTHYLLASTLATVVGVLHSYIWNKFYTFKTRNNSLKELVSEFFRFISVYAVSYFINIGCLAVLVDVLLINKYLAGALLTLTTTIISYLGHNYFSFGKRRKKNDEPPSKDVAEDKRIERKQN